MRIRYNIPSNGTLITPEVAKYIADNHITIGVSIDGIKEYHDINRVRVDGSGSFDKAMEGIENLRKNNVSPSVLITVTEENLDGLPEFTKLMIEKGMYFRFSFERDTQTGKPAMKYTKEEMCHPISELSGGQKAKILLLKIILSHANVLLLDEPTRNFSPLSGPVIRELLSGFKGAIISISHDRKYINEVCDKVYHMEKDGLTLIGGKI